MRNLIEVLNEIVHPRYKLDPSPLLTILETSPDTATRQTRCRQVTILGAGQVCALSLDNRGLEPFPFLQDVSNVKMKNDAIVFCKCDDRLYLLVIELKSGNAKEGVKQLRAGKLFADYLLGLVDMHYPGVDTRSLETKYIIFSRDPRKNVQKKADHKSRKASYVNEKGLPVAFVDCKDKYELRYFI